MAAPLSVHVGQGTGLTERGTSRPPGRDRDAVGQLSQLDELTAVEWQLLDLTVVDDFRDLCIRCPEQGRLRAHGDGVGELTNLQQH